MSYHESHQKRAEFVALSLTNHFYEVESRARAEMIERLRRAATTMGPAAENVFKAICERMYEGK